MVLDLKLVIFICLIFLLLATLLGILIGQRQRQKSILLFQSYSLEQLSLLFEAMPLGVIFLSRDLRCLYANAKANNLLGTLTQGDKLPDKPWREELYKDLEKVHQFSGQQTYYRTLSLPADQTLNWWLNALPDATIITLTDLTSQTRTEKNARLFLSNLSHEIRTPLTAILAHIEVIRLPELPLAAQQNSLNLIHQATSRISHLVQDLLELSRLEMSSELDDEHRLVDILLVAEQAISEVIMTAEERQISISLDTNSPLPKVIGNPDRLKRVLLNVLDNAIKYSRPGDQINVKLEKTCSEKLSITIQDTGPGISPEHLPYITQRLYRGNTDIPGSGIGLALVEEILRRHHSSLEIESQSSGEQTGTTVRFVLPVAPAN